MMDKHDFVQFRYIRVFLYKAKIMDAMKQSFRPISPVHTKAYTPISLFF